MNRPECSGRSQLFSRVQKIFFVAFLLLIPSGTAFSGSGEIRDSDVHVSEDHYVWIYSGREHEPYKKVPLSPVPTDQIRLFPHDERSSRLGPDDRTPEDSPKVTINVEGGKGESRQLAEEFPSDTTTDPSRMKTKTRSLLGAEVNPSPAILMIEEEGREDKLYFGFLSLTIRW